MIVRTLHEITDTERDVAAEQWRAKRLFLKADGLGFSLSETTVGQGAEMNLWYKHHQEACFVVEGEAELTERDTGAVHRLGPTLEARLAPADGALVALDPDEQPSRRREKGLDPCNLAHAQACSVWVPLLPKRRPAASSSASSACSAIFLIGTIRQTLCAGSTLRQSAINCL